jgi:hypothetical protein
MVQSICEVVVRQPEELDQFIQLCNWVDQGLYLYGSLSELSGNNQMIWGMFLGTLLSIYVRRFYRQHLRQRLLKLI